MRVIFFDVQFKTGKNFQCSIFFRWKEKNLSPKVPKADSIPKGDGLIILSFLIGGQRIADHHAGSFAHGVGHLRGYVGSFYQ